MHGATTIDRPFLISGEGGTSGPLASGGFREFSDRPPKVFTGTSHPPDNPWFVRLADWPSAQTQPRLGDSHSADGGTILLKAIDEFAEEFQCDPELGLESIDFEPESGPPVVLWVRDGDSTLRSVTIGEDRLNARRRAEIIEFPSGENSEHSPITEAAVARPLKVWTLWTNPQR
jgi:hypothetical protein